MRLVFVIDSFMIGGSELATLRTYRLLRHSAKISIVHFHAAGPLLAEYQESGAEMHHVPLFGVTNPRNALSLRRLHSILRALRPDVVHSHDAYSNIVMLAAQWPRYARPWISSRRWLDQVFRPSHVKLNHTAFLRSHAVTVNSAAVADHMVRAELIPASQLVVVPNFVEVPPPDAVWPADRNAYTTVGMVSRMSTVKRHDLAVRAIRLLIDQGLRVRLHIVGDGECRPGVERLVGELGLGDSVVFLGELRGGAQLHKDFDISLSTSDSEGSPNSVLEAMAAGRPVVATDVGGTRDLIRSGVDGLLVPAGSPEAIAAALREVIADRAALRRFGASGRDRAIRDFSPAAIQATLTTLYDRVASGSAVPQGTSTVSVSKH